MLFRLSGGRLLEFATYGTPLASSRSANRDCINIVYHHGWPSCRHEAAMLQPHALQLGLRLLAINRPGIGRTTLGRPGPYSFQSIVDDVRQLLDGLGLDKVAFMGTSGGGPYACACACLLPERTSAVVLMASMAPTRGTPGLLQGMGLGNRLGFLAINHAPALVAATLGAGTVLLRLSAAMGVGPMEVAERRRRRASAGRGHPDDVIINDGEEYDGAAAAATSAAPVSSPPYGPDGRSAAGEVTAPPPAAAAGTRDGSGGGGGGRRAAAGAGLSAAVNSMLLYAGGFSAADRAAVTRAMAQRPELAKLMSRSFVEAAAQGLGGLWEDMKLTSEPWNLPLERITVPTFIWQGDQDLNVTVGMARYLHAAIPGSRGTPGGGRGGGLRIVEGAGHLSLGLQHGGEVLQELTKELSGRG
ncbi:hypothetical protein VOLCADRAFT_104310 [Volvox carteri f. nagariensis]|uniref:AB hydrolase-1 domain-containing protein n=1 Tax=Volvox carteri f. nagariensis TaxID=3068 RepID=D8TSS1_VOLCA|nr:uncharacterized protein VOLCADRAFT_104310 [Volvox carteri f. nagariensis]EFJ49421.1 hypothetical protein VOLCADRAFT_104310 [Volvox carteri f. nagariensis]|eukprot:XP_002949402.1 hypothetical protein VOLCADRAFT_104310 [Volvox carteri f. nagariensis]